MFNRILVPLDGSELSESALPYAEELAGAFNSELELLSVCEPEQSEYRHMYQLYLQKIAEKARNHIKTYPDRDTSLSTSVKTVVLDGDPAAQIIDYIEKNDFNLVIMASHGRSGIMPWAMGSIATRIAERVDRPVLFIRAGATRPKTGKGEIFNKILTPLDGSAAGEAILPYIKALATQFDTEITLLQTIEPGQHVFTVGGLSYVNFPEPEVEALKAKAKNYLKQMDKKLAGTRATVRYEVRTGNSTREIIKHANANKTQLVALSTQSHPGTGHNDNITHKILHAGHTPLLLVRLARGVS